MKFNEEALEQAVIELMQAEKIIYQKVDCVKNAHTTKNKIRNQK